MCTCQVKVDTLKAQFGLVPDWAFIAQSGSRTTGIEKLNISIEQSRNVVGVFQVVIQVELFFNPTVKSFDDWIISWGAPSRHRANYVILHMSLAKGSGGVDGSLVGVEDYLGPLLLYFSNSLHQNI